MHWKIRHRIAQLKRRNLGRRRRAPKGERGERYHEFFARKYWWGR